MLFSFKIMRAEVTFFGEEINISLQTLMHKSESLRYEKEMFFLSFSGCLGKFQQSLGITTRGKAVCGAIGLPQQILLVLVMGWKAALGPPKTSRTMEKQPLEIISR